MALFYFRVIYHTNEERKYKDLKVKNICIPTLILAGVILTGASYETVLSMESKEPVVATMTVAEVPPKIQLEESVHKVVNDTAIVTFDPENPFPEEEEERVAMAYFLSEEDRELVARIVHLEAGNQTQEGQRAVASVVMNRLNDGYWGDTISDVLFAPSQFTPAYKLNRTTPKEDNYQAVDYVLTNGATVPEWVMYFRTNYHFSWSGYSPYAKIDDMYFDGMK